MRALQGHHSHCTLVEPAIRILAATPSSSNMAQQTSWWCYNCRQYTRASAIFCPGCGKHWQQATQPDYGTVEYQDRPTAQQQQAWKQQKGRRKSPGRPPKSPRGWEQPGANTQQLPVPPPPPPSSQGRKGVGKGKGKEKPQLEAPPSMTTPLTSTPSASSSSDMKLQEMLQALSLHKDALPENVKVLLQEQQDAQEANNAKELHRQVTAKTKKSLKLATLRAQREQYMKQWQQYVSSLAETLQKQLQDKDKALQNFADNEATLMEEIAGARDAVLQLAGGDKLSSEDLDDQDMDDPWVEAPAQKERELQLLALLQQSSKDSVVPAPKRDGSRTPRRMPKELVDLSREEPAEKKVKTVPIETVKDKDADKTESTQVLS